MSTRVSSDSPVVSVIIPAHGVAEFLGQCLDSVQAQTLEDLEVLVVDDHSPDGLDSLVRKRAEDDARVRLIRLASNVGQGFARNRGCDEARGKYVFFLDGDDLLASPRTLERLVAIADAENADMTRGRKLHAHHPVDPMAANPRDPSERFFSAIQRAGDIHALPELWHNRHLWVFLYRRAFLVEAELRFENPQWEERPFLVAAFLAARHMVVSDVNAVLYRIRADSTARRGRNRDDLELLVRNAELVCERLAQGHAPRHGAARELTLRQYVGFLLGGSRWHALLEDESEDIAPLLQRYTEALQLLDVEPDQLRSEIGIPGPLSAVDGDCGLLWYLLKERAIGLARRLAHDRTLPTEALYPALLEGTSPFARAVNQWLRTREWPKPEPAVSAGGEARFVGGASEGKSRRLILHIGASKTGSTFLQHLFDRNRLELLHQGVWYPACGYVRQPARPHKSAAHARFSEFARSGDPALLLALHADLQELGSQVHTVLLSSEAFFLARRPMELAEYLADFDVQVVIYLRRQDDWAHSQYIEFVAGGAVQRTSVDIDEWLARPEVPESLDYYETLEEWARAFGQDRIIVRVYERDRLEGGNLATDFAAATGLTDLTRLEEPTRLESNTTPPTLLSITAMRLLNALPFPGSTAYLSFARDALDRLAREEMVEPGPVELLGPDRRVQLLHTYADSNARVAREYLGRPDGKLFASSDASPRHRTPRVPVLPTELMEELIDIYRRSLPVSAPRQPRRPAARQTEVLLVEDGVRFEGTTYPPTLESLHGMRPKPFLQAVALLAGIDPTPNHTFDRLTRELRQGRMTKRQAAARLLRLRPRTVLRSRLPWRDKIDLALRIWR